MVMGPALSREKTEENYSFMSWYVNCANCGKEVLIDGPEDRCLFCGKNASKKEVIMAEKEAGVEERVAVPPKPRKRNKLWEYYEQNKEAMIADHRSMTVISFFGRWHVTASTWGKLKKQWGVQNKQPGPKPTTSPVEHPTREYKEPRPEPSELCILITEEDLAKLDDDDYRLCWVILGRIIKNRLSKN